MGLSSYRIGRVKQVMLALVLFGLVYNVEMIVNTTWVTNLKTFNVVGTEPAMKLEPGDQDFRPSTWVMKKLKEDGEFDFGFRRGRWVWKESPTKTIHKCCTFDRVPNEEIYRKPGHCKRREIGVFGNGDVVKCGGHCCECALYKRREFQEIKVPGEYDWEDPLVELPRFDAQDFCARLGNRRIVFIGDSTLGQQHATLLNQILRVGPLCTDRIHNLRSNYLLRDTRRTKNRTLAGFLVEVVEKYPDERLLVFTSTGAHHNNKTLYEELIEELVATLERIPRQHRFGPKVEMFWTTLAPPHSHCERFIKPLEPSEVEDEINPSDKEQAQYRYWNNVVYYDKLSAKAVFYKVSDIIDLSPYYLRADAKSSDCLHFCVSNMTGNPLDLFGRIIYKKLLHQ